MASSAGLVKPLDAGSTVLPAKKSLSLPSEAKVKVMSGSRRRRPASQKPCSTRTLAVLEPEVGADGARLVLGHELHHGVDVLEALRRRRVVLEHAP